jgi:hypothetical protein
MLFSTLFYVMGDRELLMRKAEIRESANQLTRKSTSATLSGGKSPLGIRGLAI